MNIPKESTIQIVGIGVIGVSLYLILKQSGLLNLSKDITEALNPLFEGSIGETIADLGYSPATPEDFGNQGLGAQIVGGSTPDEMINIPATDAALANIGMTTQNVYFIITNYGYDVMYSILQKILKKTYNFTGQEQQILEEINWYRPIDNSNNPASPDYIGGWDYYTPSTESSDAPYNGGQGGYFYG